MWFGWEKKHCVSQLRTTTERACTDAWCKRSLCDGASWTYSNRSCSNIAGRLQSFITCRSRSHCITKPLAPYISYEKAHVIVWCVHHFPPNFYLSRGVISSIITASSQRKTVAIITVDFKQHKYKNTRHLSLQAGRSFFFYNKSAMLGVCLGSLWKRDLAAWVKLSLVVFLPAVYLTWSNTEAE